MLGRIKRALASIELLRGETHNNYKKRKNELNAATESLNRQNPKGMQRKEQFTLLRGAFSKKVALHFFFFFDRAMQHVGS